MQLFKVIIPGVVILGMSVGYGVWSIRRTAPSPQNRSPHSQVDQRLKQRQPSKSPWLESIISSKVHWEERVRAVSQLPQNLDALTQQSLFDYLTNKPAEERLNEWYLVANEIMQTLRQRELAAGVYTGQMITLIESGTADPVIRDYAVQHLSQWISGIVPAAKETDPLQVTAAFTAMCHQAAAAENGQLTLVGTTFNALTDLFLHSTGPISAQRADFQKLALKLAATQDVRVSAFNRASALQAAARLDAPELPALCRELVHHTSLAPDLRLSSVAALGLCGSTADLALLRSFPADSQFHFAATAAIQRIQDRMAAR
jgi:hypothetical protein